MRKTLLLSLAVLFLSTTAHADHIGVYSDATGSSCVLSVGVSNSTVVHKFATGSTGSRFRVDLSAAPGSIFYSFNTSFVNAGVLDDDFSVSYGQCLTGAIPIGTMVALLGAGQVYVRAGSGASSILYTDCSYSDVVGSGGQASVGDNKCMASGTESATWGQIKSLYR